MFDQAPFQNNLEKQKYQLAIENMVRGFISEGYQGNGWVKIGEMSATLTAVMSATLTAVWVFAKKVVDSKPKDWG